MYCLDSNNIQRMAPKRGAQKYLWPFPFHYLLVQKSGGGHSARGTHLCDPDGSQDNVKWNRLLTDVIACRMITLQRADMEEALALCALSSVFQTDYSNWSIFQVINVAWDSAWRAREMKHSSGAGSAAALSLFRIQMCISCCSDNSIRDLLKPCEISPHACVWSQLIVQHQMRWVRGKKKEKKN